MELAEWQAFELFEPFGEYQTYYAAGIVASTIANIHTKPGTKKFIAEDFIPKRILKGMTPDKQSMQEQLEIAKQLAGVFKKKEE